jgi:ribosomal-protein-alanine N-acetyltransferase
MNFNRLNEKIEGNNLILRPIVDVDRTYINGMFTDPEIKRYYIVPKEAQQDFRKLVDYWSNDLRNGAGNCWIVFQKGSGLFSRDKQVGFITFEFRDTLKNARINYAILPDYRRNGIATKSVQLLIKKLKNEGAERIEADIDRDNLHSEKVVEKLGFTANKSLTLIDPEMMRDGEI